MAENASPSNAPPAASRPRDGGTIMHGSRLPLLRWFWAVYLMATDSNGISALQLQKQLGLGSYKSAWLLCAKLRRAMVAPGRAPLAGLVEVDQTEILLRTKAIRFAAAAAVAPGQMFVVGAVEVETTRRTPSPGRDQGLLRPLAAWLHRRHVAPGATIKPTAGRPSPSPDVRTSPMSSRHGRRFVLPWVHRAFSNAKTWALASITDCEDNISKATSTNSCSPSTSPDPPRRLPLPSRNRHRPQAANLQHVDHAGSSGISLIVRSGRPGLTAIVPKELDGANSIDVLIATPKATEIRPQFLRDFLNSEGGRRIILAESRGQIQQHFNVSSLSDALNYAPPFDLQDQYVSALARLNGVVGNATSSQVKLDSLFSSLRHRAFRGEL